MRRQEIIKRLENLSKEYNALSSQLLDSDLHGNAEAGHRQLTSTPHNVVECEAKIDKLKTENGQFKKEIYFLKDHLRRCNEQLNRYIEKHTDTTLTYDFQRFSADDGSTITRQSVYKLNALLLAYDEVINEQESAIKRMTSSVEDSFKKMKVLEDENKRFHNFYNAYNKEGSTEGDLRQVAEEARLVLEERKILVQEVELLKQKQTQMKQNYESKIKSLESAHSQEKNLNSSLEEKLKQNQSDLESLQQSHQLLQEKLLTSVAEEEHRKSVDECSKFVEQLKEAYGNESSRMKRNVNVVQKENKVLEDQLNQTSEKVKGMKKEVISYKTHMSKLLEDRKHLLQEMHGLRQESRRCSQEATNKSEKLGRLTLKIKEDRLQMIQRLAETEGKRKAAEDAWGNCVKDIARLRKLLQSKEDSLQALLSDVRFGFLRKQQYPNEDIR